MEVEPGVKLIETTIRNCEKMQPKFNPGTTHYSLLQNRIKALTICRDLLNKTNREFSLDELEDALAPLASIISKCRHGQEKHTIGTPTYNRFQNIIGAVELGVKAVEEQMIQIKRQ